MIRPLASGSQKIYRLWPAWTSPRPRPIGLRPWAGPCRPQAVYFPWSLGQGSYHLSRRRIAIATGREDSFIFRRGRKPSSLFWDRRHWCVCVCHLRSPSWWGSHTKEMDDGRTRTVAPQTGFGKSEKERRYFISSTSPHSSCKTTVIHFMQWKCFLWVILLVYNVVSCMVW